MPTTDQSTIVNAPIADVWSRFSDFHDLSWASDVLSQVDKVGDIDGGSPGAKRILNGAFHETLIEINHDEYFLKYSIDDGPSPVSKEEVDNYVGVVRLSHSEESADTLVEWASSWDCNVDDAVEFCHGIYVALLGELSKSFDQ